MTTASSPISPIDDLWREARAWLARALADFRGPAAIAQTLGRRARAAIRVRLALIECLVMKLLLIEAAHQSSPAGGGGRERPRKRAEREGDVCTPPSVSRCALDSSPRSGERKPVAHRSEDSADPSTWRVRFRLRIPCEPPRAQNAAALRARLMLPPRAASIRARAQARRLARRFEALRRVIADPRRAIAALARTLAASGAAAREIAARIARARPPHAARLGPVLAKAVVAGHDASLGFRSDTS